MVYKYILKFDNISKMLQIVARRACKPVLHGCKKLVPRLGFEPNLNDSQGRCSIQLN